MSADLHELYRKRIDDALAGGTSVQQDAALLDHLRVCPGCQGYLDANIRVIASLGSFSFEVDPMLQARTLRQLRQHGLQQRSPPLPGRRLAWACVLAAVCTVGGSLLDLHVGDAVADLLHVPSPALRGELLRFWIAPSLIPLLLFPLLPLLARRKDLPARRKERIV